MNKIPINDALTLVRDFGLLVNQVSIYGITHKVIQQQAIDFFKRLMPHVLAYGTVEFELHGDKFAVNGETGGIDMMSSRNLREKMLLHKLPGICFSPGLTEFEFRAFLSCMGKTPVKIQEMGGFEDVLKRTGIKGVSLVHFIYERVDARNQKTGPLPFKAKEPAPTAVLPPVPPPVVFPPLPPPVVFPPLPPPVLPPVPPPLPPPPVQPAVPPPNKRPKRVPKPEPESLEDGNPSAPTAIDPANHAPTQVRLRRKKVETELGALLAEVSQLVSEKHDPQSEKVVETLRSIRDTLRTSTDPAKERIATLLGQDETPPLGTPGGQPKRKKTNKPRFSHADYMLRFAELTQEIAQPLTVTNSVIEVLRQGQIGTLNETQTQFLDLAIESVDRVNQLIKYMHTLFGEPVSFSPDKAIIRETYV
jgi:hypothetical protein